MLEGQLEVLKVEVEQLGDQVDQAIQKWNLEELRRPYSRLSNLSQQLQHQAAVRWKPNPPQIRLYQCSSDPLLDFAMVLRQGSEAEGGSAAPPLSSRVVGDEGLDGAAAADGRVSRNGQQLPTRSGLNTADHNKVTTSLVE